MSEQERYLKYIAAHRAGNKDAIDKMLSEGFRPDRQRLIDLAQQDKAIREALFNKKITIRIDIGQLTGHVYGDFPYYDEEQNKIIESAYGYYPEKEGFPKAVWGPGVVKDEIYETGRLAEQFPTQAISLPLTEEAWINLAHWLSKKKKDKSYYILVGQNCSYFVDRALKEAGYADGLMDKFDPAKVQELDFRPIKIDIAQYFRYDKREIYQPHAQVPIMDSRSEEMQSGIALHLIKKAKEERALSDKQSHENHVNAFFDKYHNANFYKAYFKEKSLTIEDIDWFARNKIPGLEKEKPPVVVSPVPSSDHSISTPSLCFSDKRWGLEKQKRIEAFKQQVIRKQQTILPSKVAVPRKTGFTMEGAGRESAVKIYNCPPPYAELPLFKAISLEKPKPVTSDSGGLKITFVE